MMSKKKAAFLKIFTAAVVLFVSVSSACAFGDPPTSVPEPTSILLLGLGLAGLVSARKLKK